MGIEIRTVVADVGAGNDWRGSEEISRVKEMLYILVFVSLYISL